MRTVPQRVRAVLGALVLFLTFGRPLRPAGGEAVTAAAGGAWSSKLVQGGIALQAEIEPLDPLAAGPQPGRLVEGESVAVRFKITDAGTGQPLSGLSPAAWMYRRPAEPPDPRQCVRDVEGFVSGSLLNRPDLDLNVYFVITLNQDATLHVVDPLFGFGGSRLLTLVKLLSPGEDWALTGDQKRLFVTQPEADRVAAVDATSWKVEAQIDAGKHPVRAALQPDGAYLWVTLEPAGAEAGPGVAVVDARTLRVLARIPTGAGRHELAFSDDSRLAFVTNGDSGTVSLIDVASLRKVKDIPTGREPASIAWSALAGAAYVTHAADGTIVAIDGHRQEVTARLQVRPGLGQIRIAPGGRLAFVVDPLADAVFILDVAANRIVQTGEGLSRPDQVTFSAELAYIRQQGSESVLMIPLKQVGQEGKPVPVADFPGGQKPFGRGRRSSPAESIVRAPGQSAVLVANPSDRAIYYYKEGMAAPMGQFSNYEREPRAVLVVDRSLGERSRTGTYETVTKLVRPGRNQMAFFLESPRLVHCFEVEVLPDPAQEAERRRSQPAKVAPVPVKDAVAVGEAVPLRFRFSDPNTGAPLQGLKDVQVLIYRSDQNWQDREMAKEVEAGLYEVDFTPRRPGSYIVRVESATGRLPFHLSPQVVVRATPN